MNRPPARTRIAPAALVALLGLTLAGAQGPAKKVDIPKLIEMHNAARTKENLGPLTVNPKLVEAAKLHAKDQADREKMDHAGADGSTPAERVERQGYRYRAVGENVAYGQRTSAEVFEGWMNSPPHKANILGDFTEIGVACYSTADGVNYWCANFGKPWPKLDADAAAPALIDALNVARKEEGLPPLAPNPILADAATAHAREMAEAKDLRAKGPDEKSPSARAQEAGYPGLAIAQADASGQPDPKKAAQGWLDSEGSKKLLLGDYADIGVGLAADADGVPYWSVLLGRPRSAE